MEFGTRIVFIRTALDLYSDDSPAPVLWRPGDAGRYICSCEDEMHLVWKEGGHKVFHVGTSEFECV